jgi:hypothetical protein
VSKQKYPLLTDVLKFIYIFGGGRVNIDDIINHDILENTI